MIMPKSLPFCWSKNFSLHAHLSGRRLCVPICLKSFLPFISCHLHSFKCKFYSKKVADVTIYNLSDIQHIILQQNCSDTSQL